MLSYWNIETCRPARLDGSLPVVAPLCTIVAVRLNSVMARSLKDLAAFMVVHPLRVQRTGYGNRE
jgi:hypothetical protein